MVYSKSTGSLLTLVTLLTLGKMSMGASIPMTYCASINTGSGSGSKFYHIPVHPHLLVLTHSEASSIYMSDGLCRDSCSGSAYAVIQGQNCWCSDISPAKSVTVSTSKCNKKCSGYPDDTCGGDGVWGYMALGKDPTGTKGGDNPSPPVTTAQVSSPS